MGSILLWKETLSQYSIAEVKQAVAEFISTATQEVAEHVRLGDIIGLIKNNRHERARRADRGKALSKVEEWRQRYNSPEEEEFRAELRKKATVTAGVTGD
jgi:hypothetical protein